MLGLVRPLWSLLLVFGFQLGEWCEWGLSRVVCCPWGDLCGCSLVGVCMDVPMRVDG